MTPWVVVCLVGAVPVEDTVAAGAVGWLEVPAVSRTVAQLEGSPLGPLGQLLIPRAERALVKNAHEGHLVAALYPAVATGALDWVVALEAGGEAGALRDGLRGALTRRGFAAGESAVGGAGVQPFGRRGTRVSLFSADGRLGLASTPALAQATLVPGPKPLSGTSEYRRLAQLAPGEPRASLDVQRLYGMLARTSQGRTLAGLVDRLGLMDAQTLSATLGFDRVRGAVARGELGVAGERKGLRAALGPAVIPSRPGALPPGTLGFARASVHPRRLWELAQILASYEAPVETSLVRANVEALEGRLGKRVGDDLLGDAPRQWTVYLGAAGGVSTAVLLAEVASGAVASAFLGEIAAVLPALFPGVEAQAASGEGGTVWVITGQKREVLALGVRQDTIVVGPTAATVRAQLRRRAGADVPLGEPPAVAYGRFSQPAVALGVEQTDAGQRLLAGAGARGLTTRQLTSALGAVSFSVAPADAGFAWTLAVAPRRAGEE